MPGVRFAGQSRIVAFAEIDGGAALIALAIFCSCVIADLLVPELAIGIWCESGGLPAVCPPAIPVAEK